MSTLIIIFAVIATLHFIYEAILLPTIRMKMRDKLFVLRDELRAHRIDSDAIDMEAFKVLSESINVYLNKLPNVNFSFFYRGIKELENNEKVKEAVISRARVISNSDDKVILDIAERCEGLLLATLILNSGAWFLYIIPVAVCILFLKRLSKLISQLFISPAKTVSYVNKSVARFG